MYKTADAGGSEYVAGGRKPYEGLLRINNLTTCTKRCGISCYSDLLYSSPAREGLDVVRVPLPQWSSNPLVYARAGIDSGRGADLISVQYALGVFGKLLNVPKLRGINYFPLIWLFLMAHRMAGKKVVYTVHEINPTHPWEKVCLPLLRMSGDGFLVLSARVRRDLERAGIEPGRIKILPFPLRKAERLPKERCREALGIRMENRVLLLFGFVARSKGFDLVLRALPDLPEDVVVVVAGSPRVKEDVPYHESLKDAARSMRGRVVFKDYVEDAEVPLVLGAADLAIEPYRSIHNSGVLTDFLSYGLPVLSSDLEYFSGIAEAFGCIETFRSGDPGDLALKAKRLLGDKERLAALADATARYRRDAANSLSLTAQEYRRILSLPPEAAGVRGRAAPSGD